MLLAAHNFNVQGDQASCMGSQYQEVNDDLEKGVLEVRTGDLVRYNSKTKYPNICLGELIRSTSAIAQTDELLRKPIFGLFDVRRCVYAKGVVEEPKADPQEVSMWQNYMDFTASNATATPEAQEEIDLQQAIRQSLLTDQGEQLPQTESALSTGVTMKPPLPSKRSVPLPQPLTRDEVTEEMIAQLHEPNEAAI